MNSKKCGCGCGKVVNPGRSYIHGHNTKGNGKHVTRPALQRLTIRRPAPARHYAGVISELKTAFIMGFCISLPFLLVDLVISSMLTSMGMVMMPPVVVSAPFKLLLFVLANGWNLVTMALTVSFR